MSDSKTRKTGAAGEKEDLQMDIYWHFANNGLRWNTTQYAHYISLGHLQINIRRAR